MNILENIIAYKKQEVANRRNTTGIDALQQSPMFGRACFSLCESLAAPGSTGIIAEFKRQSPSKGVINNLSTVQEVTAAYAKAAAGLSVLTDTPSFGGTTADLRAAREQNIPILRKDFMIDEYQVYEAKAMGADVILLIAAVLSPQAVHTLGQLAKQLGMEVLLEIHDDTELEHITDAVDLVGVNNRNLKTFEVSIQTSIGLFSKIPASKPAISESGIAHVDTILALRSVGFRGFLIGENFMKQNDPAIAFADFVNQLKARS